MRAFLAAGQEGRPRAQLATGRLRALLEVEEEAAAGIRVTERRLHVGRVEERSNDGREALVDLRATSMTVVTHRGHEHTNRVSLDGPVRLLREEGAWMVADHHRDGIPLTESVCEPAPAHGDVGGVHARVVSYIGRRGLVVLLNFANTRAETVVLDRLVVRTRTRTGLRFANGSGLRHALPAGGSSGTALLFGRMHLTSPFGVEIRFVGRGAPPTISLELTPPAALPLRVRVRHAWRPSTVWAVLLLLALVLWAWSGNPIWAAVLLFLGGVYGTFALILALITGVHSPASAVNAAVGVTALAAGTVLLVTSPSFGVTQTVLFGVVLLFGLLPNMRRAWVAARARPAGPDV